MAGGVCFSLAVSHVARAQGEDSEAAVAELRETIAKIVDVKAQTSRERSEWETQRATMAELLELHARELQMLDEELAAAGRSAGGYDSERRAAEAAIDAFRAAKAQTAEVVARARKRALALAKRFPEPVARETAEDRLRLESWQPGNDPRDGLLAILGMIAKAEQFNRSVRRSHEEREGRMVEVVYLGLARAYYVDSNGDAGIGEPGPEGWEWSPREGIAAAVRGALAQLDRKSPPQLVELPVRIAGEK